MDIEKRLSSARLIKHEMIRGRVMEAWLHESAVTTVRIFENEKKVAEFNYVKGTRFIDLLSDVNNFFEALK